jgi:hypothetical protein
MKGILIWIVALVFMSVCLKEAEAWFWDKKGGTKEQTTEAGKKQPAVEKTKPKTEKPKKEEEAQKEAEKQKEEARKAKRLLIEQRRKEIDNVEWKIQLVPLAGKGKAVPETVVFKKGQVAFDEFSKKGFNPSNFSLKIQEDNVIVWETMQSAEKSGVIFWRGEITPDMQKMRGVLSYQVNEKKKEDYSFISTERKSLPPEQ